MFTAFQKGVPSPETFRDPADCPVFTSYQKGVPPSETFRDPADSLAFADSGVETFIKTTARYRFACFKNTADKAKA